MSVRRARNDGDVDLADPGRFEGLGTGRYGAAGRHDVVDEQDPPVSGNPPAAGEGPRNVPATLRPRERRLRWSVADPSDRYDLVAYVS